MSRRDALQEYRPGDRVMILDPHPWKGHTGTIKGRFRTALGALWRVAIDGTHHTAGVKKPQQMKRID